MRTALAPAIFVVPCMGGVQDVEDGVLARGFGNGCYTGGRKPSFALDESGVVLLVRPMVASLS